MHVDNFTTKEDISKVQQCKTQRMFGNQELLLTRDLLVSGHFKLTKNIIDIDIREVLSGSP